ncbi:MAG: glycoside hydrolase family 3 C-terminal domain-containing protein [Oscillospiraceae bacterium]|nr:glycoside hydrolase family 3 C-terminal domain-containing protein [Oscillospiraceae bacterium]
MDNIEQILTKMTLEDKIALCSGASFWETKKYEKYGIPSMFMCDGPSGLRKQEHERGVSDAAGVNDSRPATCYPAEVTTAGSWDTQLLGRIGEAIGVEAKNQSVGLVLGPGANIKRNPLCGRNFEYFSEDPHLAGKLAAGFIRGIEGQGVGASLKHFAANSQEYCRFTSDGVMDERTLREIYLTNFEIAVKEGNPSIVMCSYPKLGGVHCSDHRELLTDILRTEWGYAGLVVTDWGAMSDRIEGFRAGCDLNMPGGSGYMEKQVLRAVERGGLFESCVNESARRVLKLVFRATETRNGEFDCDYEAHHGLAREAAEQGAVLLKNEGGILPLKADAKVALIGAMAKRMRYQGAGSSHVTPMKLSQPIDFLPDAVYAPGCDDRGNTTDELMAEAIETAKNADVAVVFAGLPEQYESEGFDREDLRMPEGHNRLIEAVASANPNTVVVLLCGSVVECPWAERVRGILYMGLPGQAGGEAIANLLYGRANPCGKLAESWPYEYADVPSSEIFGKTKDALYQEGVYVGYRYYDKAGVPVRWGFGFGLSYTSFSYSNLNISGNSVTVTVKNTGKVPGAEVAQLYIEPPRGGLHRPIRELKGFRKVFLEPGESETVSFELEERSLAVWDGGWRVTGGVYTACVGGLSAVIERGGRRLPAPLWQGGSWYESCKGKPSQEEWEAMLGKKYVPSKLVKGQFTMENTVEEMREHSLVMKIVYKAVEKTLARSVGGKKGYDNPEFKMLLASSVGAPLRTMQINGGLKGGLMPGLLEMANGHFFRGVWKMVGGA